MFKQGRQIIHLFRSLLTLTLLTGTTIAAQVTVADWLIDKVAGVGRPRGDNGQAASALLYTPTAIAVDDANNFYFTEQTPSRIRKIDATGRITTIAGNGTFGYTGDGGPALAAGFNQPTGITVDPAGNVYVTDVGYSVVRRITPAGIISTVAGTGIEGFSGDGGQATLAQLNQPFALAFRDGSLYIADSQNFRIRKVSPSGMISTVAGTGQSDLSTGGPALSTPVNLPGALAFGPDGTLYIGEYGTNRVVALSPALILTPIAGSGPRGFSGDGGPALKATLAKPLGLAVDASGVVFLSDNDNNRIRKIANGIITTVAGSSLPGFSGDGQLPAAAQFENPVGLAFDRSGKLYVCDTYNNRIRKLDFTSSLITTFAGTVAVLGDGGPAQNASLFVPSALAFDAAGNLYIADSNDNRIRKVTPQGIISTVAGNGTVGFSGDGADARNAQLNYPQGVAIDSGGNVLISDTGNTRVRRIDLSGIIQTIAGSGTIGFSGDGGPARQAMFDSLQALATDALGNIYVADMNNNRIRKINSAGVITTFAGGNLPNLIGDGGPANVAGLNAPRGVAADSLGNVFIADTDHSRIRKVSIAGVITTVAGVGIADFMGDGLAAISARLSYPTNVAVDKVGNLFINDALNARIRMVNVSGVIDTIAGDGGLSSKGDGGSARTASLGDLTGLAFAPDGRLYFADGQNHLVRRLTLVTVPQTPAPILSAAGIANAASFASGPVAPGEIITLYGTGLAVPSINIAPVQTTVVTFNGKLAPLLYVSATQLSVIVPYGLAGSARLQVTANGGASNTVIVPIVEAAPGLFTANSSGTGQAAVLNQDGSVNSPQNPAAKGSTIVLYGTGEGETNPPGVDGRLAGTVYPKPILPVGVLIGGRTATVTYAGAAPGLIAGVFQINAVVPDETDPGAASLSVTVGSQSSPVAGVTVSIR